MSGSEDAIFYHLQEASINLNRLGCDITDAVSNGEGWPTAALYQRPDSIINNTLF